MEILELLSAFGDYGTQVLKYLVRVSIIALGSLGVIYSIGRMLEIKMKTRTKNIIALICNFLFSWIITYIYFPSTVEKMAWETTIFGLVATVGYVLFLWKLYSRVDSWLDKKGFKNKR